MAMLIRMICRQNVIPVLISLLMSVRLIAAEPINEPLPDFTLKNSQGVSVHSAELHGQVILLNFWATWCRPCLEEMPLLVELYNEYHKSGFTVLGINVEDTANSNKRAQVDAFISSREITFPILYDPHKNVVGKVEQHIMARRMGLPTTLFIDRKGNARYLHEGYMPGDERDYRRLIERLIEE